ncbi:MAG: hypothetical protein HY906_08300 [Deltaproteobacteria bacterium]|nr:hypothetical protein [Deltaproteobacteria bacterium]
MSDDSGEAGRGRAAREALAELLRRAEIELRAAQVGVQLDGDDVSRRRYARAVYPYDRLQGMFPFVLAGLGPW